MNDKTLSKEIIKELLETKRQFFVINYKNYCVKNGLDYDANIELLSEFTFANDTQMINQIIKSPVRKVKHEVIKDL